MIEETPKKYKINKEDKFSPIRHRERRKKAADSDPELSSFSDHELLEFMLFNCIPRIDTKETAYELLNTFGSFSAVMNASIEELKQVKGVSEHVARMIWVTIPSARRAEQSRTRSCVYIANTIDAVNLLAPYFMNCTVEKVYLLSLTNSNRAIAVNLISSGDTNIASVEFGQILSVAHRNKASKVVLAHNHPSGNSLPSANDISVTTRLMAPLMYQNSALLDHIIFSQNGYYSFYVNGRFEEIYQKMDKAFNTNFVKEFRSKITNYRQNAEEKVKYFSEDNKKPEFTENPLLQPYSAFHPTLNKSLEAEEE